MEGCGGRDGRVKRFAVGARDSHHTIVVAKWMPLEDNLLLRPWQLCVCSAPPKNNAKLSEKIFDAARPTVQLANSGISTDSPPPADRRVEHSLSLAARTKMPARFCSIAAFLVTCLSQGCCGIIRATSFLLPKPANYPASVPPTTIGIQGAQIMAISRRQFVKRSALAVGAASLPLSAWSHAAGSNDQIRVAVIGVKRTRPRFDGRV